MGYHSNLMVGFDNISCWHFIKGAVESRLKGQRIKLRCQINCYCTCKMRAKHVKTSKMSQFLKIFMMCFEIQGFRFKGKLGNEIFLFTFLLCMSQVRRSFKKFYFLLQNFVNIKASQMKFVTIVALSHSYTFTVNPISDTIFILYPYTCLLYLIPELII